jgi:hypothetical protein
MILLQLLVLLALGSVVDLLIWGPRRRQREALERRLRALEEREQHAQERERSVWARPPTEAMEREFRKTGKLVIH